MIIKSLSRKKASFENLLNYINREKNNLTIAKNLYSNEENLKEIAKEFKENAELLKYSKGSNYLYHEIISLAPSTNEKLKPQELEKILIDIWEQYLNLRANKCLSYGKIHKDKDNLHLHFCISANEINSSQRLSYKKAKFREIQKEVEEYLIKSYPNLEEARIYTKSQDRNQEQSRKSTQNNLLVKTNKWELEKEDLKNSKVKLKLSTREQEIKRRTKEPTKKEQVSELLIKIFDNSDSRANLLQNLKMNWLEIYQRWNTISVLNTQDKRKYRLKTLNLEEKLKECKERFKLKESNLKDLQTFREELESRELKDRNLQDKKANSQNSNQTLNNLNNSTMNSKEAKQIPIRELLNKLWYSPSYQKGSEFWYISPFREEKSPSFKIDENKNLWFDFWEGRGWNIIDFMMIHQNQDFKTALREISQLMEEYRSFKVKNQQSLFNSNQIEKLSQKNQDPIKKASAYHQEQTHKVQDKKLNSIPNKPQNSTNSKIQIKKIQNIQNLALIDYLEKRAVNPNIAKLHLKEIYYSLWWKHYFSLAFKNQSNWYELRNPYFKWVVGNKDLTIIKNSSKELLIFEGFLDFLSFISLNPNSRPRDFIILNSIALTPKAINYIKSQEQEQSYLKIECFLDNDSTGKKAFNLIKENLETKEHDWSSSNKQNFKIIDKSYIYKNHKDFNEFIQHERNKNLKNLQELQDSREPLERIREI